MTYEMCAERRAVACCSDFLPGALPGAEPARKPKAAGSSGEPERASSAELQRVSGIGPSTVDKILQLRKSYGGYKSVDDLLAIKGIGRERLDKMHKYRTGPIGGGNHGMEPGSAFAAALTESLRP